MAQQLNKRSLHEFWRLQLLDELRRKLDALEWEPALDPSGARREALEDLIHRFEEIEASELRAQRDESENGVLVPDVTRQPTRRGADVGRVGLARALFDFFRLRFRHP